MRYAKIAATGSWTPSKAITNEELVKRFDLEIEPSWIARRTGIKSRHWLDPELATSDMAVEAARVILERGGVEASQLDRIILATITPDFPSPATATIVAGKLGVRCTAFDVSAACAGFPYALELAASAIQSGDERVLVLCADTRSRFVDPNDRRSLVLFGDGAAGALVVASEEPGFVAISLGSEGGGPVGAYVPAGGSARPASVETVMAGEHYVKIDPLPAIFAKFKQLTRESCEAVLEKAQVSLSDIDLFVTHQGNQRMLEVVLAELGIPSEKAVDNVAHHGNTAGAAVPIALAEAIESGRISKGDLVLICSVGAGFSFGAAIHRF